MALYIKFEFCCANKLKYTTKKILLKGINGIVQSAWQQKKLDVSKILRPQTQFCCVVFLGLSRRRVHIGLGRCHRFWHVQLFIVTLKVNSSHVLRSCPSFPTLSHFLFTLITFLKPVPKHWWYFSFIYIIIINRPLDKTNKMLTSRKPIASLVYTNTIRVKRHSKIDPQFSFLSNSY